MISDSVVARESPPLGVANVFATAPQSLGADPKAYLRNVAEVARWSERAGCEGILVYTDNGIVDPWLVAQAIIENTTTLCPLVAVQPVYMHPYAVAKMVTSLAFLYGRRIYLNMVAGGFKNDLVALNDTTPHDKRYDRLVEYTTIIKRLLEAKGPVTFDGEFYKTDKLTLKPPLAPELTPGIFVSGSSEAGMAAAQAMGATAVKYPGPPEICEVQQPNTEFGIRVGIVTRDREDAAWRVALDRFPEDRRGALTHELAMKVSDSSWHKQLSRLDKDDQPDTYWLGPFENSKTNCPYLVGSYDQVAAELAVYMLKGYRTYILDIPPSEEELDHIGLVFRQAVARCAP